MLQAMLNTHSQIVCYPELFNPTHPAKVKGQIAAPNEEFMESYIYTDPEVQTGFKLITYQMRDMSNEFKDYLFYNSRVVFIDRINTLNCFLSQRLARQYGFRNKIYQLSPFFVDGDELNRYFEYIKEDVRNAKKFFRMNCGDTTEITYENLIGDAQEKTLMQVFNFLGVEYEEIRPVTKKQRTYTKAEAVTNYAELKARFADTEYGPFFDDL